MDVRPVLITNLYTNTKNLTNVSPDDGKILLYLQLDIIMQNKVYFEVSFFFRKFYCVQSNCSTMNILLWIGCGVEAVHPKDNYRAKRGRGKESKSTHLI